MWRFLVPALVMVGALVVLLAGALGDLKSLPDLSTKFPALIASVVPNRTAEPDTNAASAASSPATGVAPATPAQQAATAPAQQPATVALQQQLTELQAQIAQGTKEVAALRSDADVAHRELDTLQQQRQTEEAAVARLQSQHQQLTTASPTEMKPGPAPAEASVAAAQQQAANDALQRQATELQAQIKQRSDELASLRTSEEEAHHELDISHQQRQAEEAGVARLQAQQKQLAAVEPPPARPRPQQQPSQTSPDPSANTAMQTTLAALRAKERVAAPQPQQQPPTQPTSAPPPNAPAPPVLIVSTRGVLVTARDLLAAGRAADARQLLMKAQAESTLHQVTPDQPFATGRSAAALRISDAIRLLDAGNTGSALRAINLAMDSTVDSAGGWPAYPQASGGYGASANPQNYNGGVRR